jgi:hypothetical protein
MHYTPTGSPQEDLTKIGMLFADPDEIEEETVTMIAINRNFRIPPRTKAYEVKASVEWMPHEGRILSLAPHMHLRGRSFRFVARRSSDGNEDSEEILLDVPNYDFNWQHVYQLAQPFTLTADLKIEATATFDNSDQNLVNPDPSATVRWGDQTWQEMMVGFLDVAVPKDAELELPYSVGGQEYTRSQEAGDELIATFDQNGDGQLERSETPTQFAIFAFHKFDRNDDDVITRAEACDE